MSEQTNRPTPKDKSQQESQDIFDAIFPFSNTKPPVSQKAESRHCRPDQSPIAQRWLEVIGLAVVAAYTTYAGLQWKTMNQTYGEIQKQTIAAQTAATTAAQALQQNTDAFKVDERGRIKVKISESGWDPRMEKVPLVASYHFSNIGKTEAQIIAYDKHVSLVDFRPNVGNLSPQAELPKKGIVHLMYNGDEQLLSVFNYAIPIAEDSAVKSGKKLVVSWGCIEYKDIFGDLHWADFCDIREPPPNQEAYASCAYQCQREKPSK